MACSNNVVRAALTPKFRDVNLLVEMLTYNMGAPAVLPAETVDACRKRYTPPINDFEIQILQVWVNAFASFFRIQHRPRARAFMIFKPLVCRSTAPLCLAFVASREPPASFSLRAAPRKKRMDFLCQVSCQFLVNVVLWCNVVWVDVKM